MEQMLAVCSQPTIKEGLFLFETEQEITLLRGRRFEG